MELQDHFSIRLYEKTMTNLSYLLAQWEAKPYLIKNAPDNRSALINMLLIDYTNFLIEEQRQNPKKSYDQIAAELNSSSSQRETADHLQSEFDQLHKGQYQLLDRINEMLYLEMANAKKLGAVDHLYELESMYEFGTFEYNLRNKLRQQVDEDNKRLFIKSKQKNKNH